MTSINVTAVTSQKIAIGAVENPACQRLRELAAAVPADQAIVELGAFKGRSAGWLALGASEGNGAHITSIDPWETRPLDSWPENYFDERVLASYSEPGVHQTYLDHLAECGVTDLVTPVIGYGHEVAATWDQPVGLLWHDAGHSYEEVERDLLAWVDHVAPGGVVVLHDAGNPHFGVVTAAAAVLAGRADWHWVGRELLLWPKQPDKRGILLVRRKH